MGFIVYQMDLKSAFLYGKIDEEVYVSQPPGFLDPKYLKKVYKVVKALYRLHQAPRAWYLKGKPKLGLWYPRMSSFDLEAYSDSDYAGANIDRKSTTEGCQFLGMETYFLGNAKIRRKIMATSTTVGRYVAVQLLWAKFCGFKIKWMPYEKIIIQVLLKIHTDDNVADLLTKAFDVSRFQFLVCAEAFLTIGDEFQEVHWVLRVIGKR
ncbi:ribonuclease H-like domain, reverse transcriptase, RNA-dependent DNA polymerase [Tanacetum coccineum]|uniref:Ribonuclease H-like domain, reverse transcriptase, RNA-dependent DNA polymerase n=1 Tax=Tanacetum coccineum TaxID=301880 RepID=A0ABQ5A6X4_9ASTR